MSKIKVWAGLVSAGVSLLGPQITIFLLCPHMAFPIPGVCVLISSSYKDTSQVGLGPTLMASF